MKTPLPVRWSLTTLAVGLSRPAAIALALFGLTALSLALATLTALGRTAPAQQRPDIVLIVTDDQRYDLMQFMPLTNSLIGDQGVRFTRAFAPTALCCPSRAGILTGLHSHNHGVIGNVAPNGGATVFDDRSTLATWLRAAGYRTALIGKYLNEYSRLTPWPYIPPGWQVWRALKESAGYYSYTIVTETGAQIPYSGRTTSSYSTNLLASEAVQFIDNAVPGKPFFLYFAPFAPHHPALQAPEDVGKFAALPPLRPPSYNELDVSDKPSWVRALPPMKQSVRDTTDAVYRRQAESLQAVDRAVRDIMVALQAKGRLANAVIIFTSDNGLALGEHRYYLNKGCVYEECVHVPLLVRAPGILPREDAHLISNVDLAPTIARFAGITPPVPVNGMSFKQLLSDPGAPWRSALLLETLTLNPKNQRAVRTNRYVYVEYKNGDRELYDLAADPHQLANAVNDPANAQVVANLKSRLAALKSK